MPEIPDAVYEAAYEAFKRAPLGSSIVRACVDAVWPLAVAEGRRQAAEAIRNERPDHAESTDAYALTHARHRISTFVGRTRPNDPPSPSTWSCSCGKGGSGRGYRDHLDQALAVAYAELADRA